MHGESASGRCTEGAQREGTGDAEESGGPHHSSCVGLVLQSVVSLEFEEASGGILRSIMALYLQISTAPLIKRLLMRTGLNLRYVELIWIINP